VAAHRENFVILACTVFIWMKGVTDRRSDRQTERQTDRRPGHGYDARSITCCRA